MKMKAALVTDVHKVSIQEIDRPVLKDDEVLIKVKTVGVCGSDLHLFRGTHAFRKPPAILGHEIAGDVVEIGKSVKHDVSIPISRIAEFVQTTNVLLQKHFPGIQHVVFGHLGDGNLHYNVARAASQTEDELMAQQYDIYQVVHDSVHAHGGSISAEHGVGQLKRDQLPRYKSALELKLMKQIKVALDPNGLMNPGKVLQA